MLFSLRTNKYFQKKVYRALNVPISRLDSQTSFQLGRAAEITRDEVKFAKFINRIRIRFTHLFDELLKKQLILKKVISADEWDQIKEHVKYDFNNDNHYAELKNAEIIKNRLDILSSLDQYTDKYYSVKWIRENVLKQTTDEQEQIDAEIEEEKTKYGPSEEELAMMNDSLEDPEMSDSKGSSNPKNNSKKSKKSSKNPKKKGNEDADGDEQENPKYN